jgi:class 3 adenylate cyclase/tetratricopeptide (TPR) repeat protein
VPGAGERGDRLLYSFEDFSLDTARRELRRSGALISLQPQVFDLLEYSIRNRERVVSKDDLLAAVWHGRIVSESTLSTRINAARSAIGDSGEEQLLLRTTHGKGIRFVGAVREEEEATVRASRQPDPISAERRQITVMSCNLAEATALASRLDPEDLRDLIVAYQRTIAEIVARFDGFVAKHLGDGVLIYFGYPGAHEDDAERAIRCAQTVAETVTRLELGEELPTRVGIATSMVVVNGPTDGGDSREISVMGEAPSLAVRLQDLTAPNSVLIAESTRRLVGELFEYRAVQVNGFAGPVRAWQVLRPSAVASRFEALRGSALTRLVGRGEEIDLLLRRWARAKTGEGQVVLLSGEPGIGKSRIAAALAEHLDGEPHIRLRYFCSPYHQDSALFPIIDQLGRASGFAPDDPPASKLEKLEALLARAAPPDEDVALIADLMSLPASGRHPLPNISPQRKKERTLEALIRQLEGLARKMPVISVFEDAHWIDPTSREVLDLTIERVRSLPVLLIVTFRPEFQPPWIGQPQLTMLTLNRLDQHDRTALVEQIVGGKALPDEVVDQIVDRTDGVPLFIEELTKSVLESGLLREEADRYVINGSLSPFAIPMSLHASLMARLDRLTSVQHVAQVGAAIGRKFPYTLLHAVSRTAEDELQASLARLVAAELVFQRGTPPDAVYAFKNSLVQDAAHSSLPRNVRQQLHAQIAEALEAHSPELMDTQPELLAQHYAEAGLVEKSLGYWRKAGHRSAARSAMAEAAAQFCKGLDQLALLPDTPERQRQELEFCSSLGAVLLVVKGYAAPETGDTYARARELWEQLGSPSEFLRVPFGQSAYHTYRGEFDLALGLDEDLLCLSRQRNDPAGLVLGHQSFGRNLFFVGRFASSQSHLEEALALYDPISHRSLGHQIGSHPHVNAQAWLGTVLFCLGYPDRALARSSAAIADARRLAHPPSLAGSLATGIRLHLLGGDNAFLGEWVDQLVGVTTEQGFPHWRAVGTIFRGWVKVKNGDVTEGISLLRSGSASRSTGAWVPHNIALLAAACETAGQIEEAVTLLDDALHIVQVTGERSLEAELNRHKGQLLLRQGHAEAAGELFRKALGIAVEQGAKLWELRAAVSLARLRRDQGCRTEARDFLAPVYGWFTEGFGTPDLKEAKALLDELDGSSALTPSPMVDELGHRAVRGRSSRQ